MTAKETLQERYIRYRDYSVYGGEIQVTAEQIRGFFEMKFNPEELTLMDSLVNQIELVKDKYPILSLVDMVVEGGVGQEKLMREVVRETFPQALYVGMDLSETLRTPFYRSMIDLETVSKIIKRNQNSIPTFGDYEIRANCFDYGLVQDMLAKAEKKYPLLVSMNGLFALESNVAISPYELKEEKDKYSYDHWFSEQSPYVAHLHLYNSPLRWKDRHTNEMMLNWPWIELHPYVTGTALTVEEMENGLCILLK